MRIVPGADVPRRKRKADIDPMLAAMYPRESRWVKRQPPPWQGVVLSLFRQMGGWRCYHTKRSDGSNPGYPDLHCVHPASGTSVYAELKIEEGELTDDQIAWLLDLAACHEHVYVWRPSDREEIDAVLRAAHERGLLR